MNKEQNTENKDLTANFGNNVLADSSFYIAVPKTRNIEGKELVKGKIIQAFDGKTYGIYKTSEIGSNKVIWSLTCLHTGYSLQRFLSLEAAINDQHLDFCFDRKKYEGLLKKAPINDLKNFR